MICLIHTYTVVYRMIVKNMQFCILICVKNKINRVIIYYCFCQERTLESFVCPKRLIYTFNKNTIKNNAVKISKFYYTIESYN